MRSHREAFHTHLKTRASIDYARLELKTSLFVQWTQNDDVFS